MNMISKYAIVMIFFIGGLLLGLIAMYLLGDFGKNHFRDVETTVVNKNEIITPYMLLYQLRKDKSDEAVKLLEMQLDVALYSFAYKLENNITSIDTETQNILNKIREYRQKYPHEYVSNEYKQKIDSLLKL